MDTKHLLTFLTFAREKSYLKASQTLNYAPSTLVSHIKSLEEELQIKLIESKGKRSLLTKAGEQFFPYAQQMMDIYKKACADMASMNSISGTLRVMTVESLGLYSLSNIFSGFMRNYPDLILSISIGNCDKIYDRLRQDDIDIAFLYDMEPICAPDLLTTVLFKEKLVFTVSPKHPLAQKHKISPSDFRMQTFIHAQRDCYYSKALHDMLNEYGVIIKQNLELDSGSLIKYYVQSGYGITLLPYSVIRDELESGSLVSIDWDGPSWDAYAQIVYLKKEWILPAVKELVKFSANALRPN